MINNALGEASREYQQEVQKLMAALREKQDELKEKESEFQEMNQKLNEYKVAVPRLKMDIRRIEQELSELHTQEEREKRSRTDTLKKSGVTLR